MNVRDHAHDYAAALAPLPRRRDQLLPALHAVHHVAGWLSEAAIEAAARHVFVPLSEMYGIVTSYGEFRLAPPDPERVEVCTGLTCRIAGADAIIAALEDEGRPIERVPCRFLCAIAPVMAQHGAYAGRGERPHAAHASGAWAVPRTHRTGRGVAAAASFTTRRETAIEAARALARRTRISISDGVAARAVGTGARLDQIMMGAGAYAAGAGPLLVRVGSDGAHHAEPVLTVRIPDGTETRFERVSEAVLPAIIAAVQGKGGGRAAEYPGQVRRVTARCGVIDPESFDEALAAGAYAGLERALAMPPEAVVELVRAAGLRGRGGAYFPAAVKWASARANPAPRYLVVNAEEGEPGVFKDRHLMEGDPHALVEGTLIAAYACGAEAAFIYINGQAELSATRIEQALADAHAVGLVGEHILGSGFSCTITVYRGAGGYVCGEESVILNSIEGERAVPRFRPPLPTERGLWGRPTVINNVETLCNLPLILVHGAEWFREVGSEPFPGTKLMSLSGAIQRPGLYEVPMGMRLREIIETCGGGALPGHAISFAVVGGPSGGLMPASLLDVPIAGGMLHPSGPVLGAGGIVVLDERTSPWFVLRELTAYNKDESCGKCTPCREGAARARALLDTATDPARPPAAGERAMLLDLCEVMQTGSLCGLGQMAPGPIRSALELFA